jgi:hypothetical protein
MATRTLDPREELPIVLAKLRLARNLDPKHTMENPDGSKAIHIDCHVCVNQKRLDYLLDMLSKRYKLREVLH